MRKIKLSILLMIIVLASLISTSVFAVDFESNGENKKRENLFKETLSNYMMQYQKEDTPEEKRIISYEMNGFGISEETEEILAVSISFIVEPYSKENTIWKNSKGDMNNGDYLCFAKYKKVNGGYELEKVSEVPEGYDIFLEKFEEYKANNPNSTQENRTIQGKENKAYQSENVVNNISIVVYAVNFAILVISLIFIIKFIRKKQA